VDDRSGGCFGAQVIVRPFPHCRPIPPLPPEPRLPPEPPLPTEPPLPPEPPLPTEPPLPPEPRSSLPNRSHRPSRRSPLSHVGEENSGHVAICVWYVRAMERSTWRSPHGSLEFVIDWMRGEARGTLTIPEPDWRERALSAFRAVRALLSPLLPASARAGRA